MQKRLSCSVIFLLLFLSTLLVNCKEPGKPITRDTQADSAQSSNEQIPIVPAGNSADSSGKDSIAEKAVLDSIFNLPEVKQGTSEIEKATKGKRHLQVWVEDSPHLPDQPYYIVNTGEDNGSSLVTETTFYVYTHPMRILYYDVVNDTAITLEAWREDRAK